MSTELMSDLDEFEDDVEELCKSYLDDKDVERDELADVLVAVKNRLNWSDDYS